MPDNNKVGPSAEAIARLEEGIRERYRSQFNTLPKTTLYQDLQDRSPSAADKNAENVPNQVIKPRTSIDITHQNKVTAPNIKSKDGEVVAEAGTKVRGPRHESLERFEKARAAEKLIEIQRKEREEELVRELSPEVLLNKLAATERVVKALQKKVAKLEADNNEAS